VPDVAALLGGAAVEAVLDVAALVPGADAVPDVAVLVAGAAVDAAPVWTLVVAVASLVWPVVPATAADALAD